MPFIHYLLLTSLGISSLIVLIQDFKYREISLWVLLLFGLSCLMSLLVQRDFETLLYNSLATLCYLTLLWLIIKLYLFVKFKKNKTIINEQLGLADVLIIFFIGITFNLIGLILFFCFGFVFSLVWFLLYNLLMKEKAKENIPLAGLLVLFYGLSVFVLFLIKEDNYIDCSFLQ